MKRGIAPLIMTVILIGATVVLAVLIISSGVNIQKSMIKNQETDVQKLGLLDYRASYKDSDCKPVLGETNCYRILIVNNEEFPLNFVITTKTSLGSYVSDPNEFKLNAYEPRVFVINYPSSLGTKNVQAEVNGIKS